MLRASFSSLLGVIVIAFSGAVVGCDARLVDSYSTTQVILRATPGFGSCTLTQELTIDLTSHSLAYSICPTAGGAGTTTAMASTPEVGTIVVTNAEYPGLLSKLEAMKEGSSSDEIEDAGTFTADILDNGDTLQYVDARTPDESDRKKANGVMDAFDAALAIVESHRAAGDVGAAGVTGTTNVTADAGQDSAT